MISISTTPASAQIAKQSYQGHDAAANEVLIKFQQAPPNDPQAQAEIAADIQQAEVTGDIDVARAVGSAGWMRFHSRSNDVTTLMSIHTGAAGVAYVEPNWIAHTTSTPNDPYLSQEWGLQNTGQTLPYTIPNDTACDIQRAGTPGADISAVQAWNISPGSTAIVVGVVDTGIHYNHPDLAANVWSAPAQYSFYQGTTQYTCPAGTHGWNTFTNACDPSDDHGHGTHVSGTIGAATNNGVGVAGVNWSTKIIACKFLNSSGSGTTANAVNCLQFMEGIKGYFGGKGGAADVRALNNSWGGGGFSQALLDEIYNTYTADMMFVAAAGNNSSDNDTTPFYPASYNAPNVVSVAATDNRDSLVWFSNYGSSTVQLGAPGDCVYSTVPPHVTLNPSSELYKYLSGTSMATPHVSGTAALSESVCQFDTELLKPNLLNDVVVIPSLSGKTVTGGRVNAYNSLNAASGGCPGTGYASISGTEKSICRIPNPNGGCAVYLYDGGTVSIIVNGVTKTVNYGEGSTSGSLASDLYNAINGDGTYPARAHVSGSKVSLSAKRTGADTCYSVSGSSTTLLPNYFHTPSFRITVSGLSGCR